MYVAQLFKHIMHCSDLDDLRGIVMMHRLIYFISVTNVSRFSLRSIPLDFLPACMFCVIRYLKFLYGHYIPPWCWQLGPVAAGRGRCVLLIAIRRLPFLHLKCWVSV